MRLGLGLERRRRLWWRPGRDVPARAADIPPTIAPHTMCISSFPSRNSGLFPTDRFRTNRHARSFLGGGLYFFWGASFSAPVPCRCGGATKHWGGLQADTQTHTFHTTARGAALHQDWRRFAVLDATAADNTQQEHSRTTRTRCKSTTRAHGLVLAPVSHPPRARGGAALRSRAMRRLHLALLLAAAFLATVAGARAGDDDGTTGVSPSPRWRASTGPSSSGRPGRKKSPPIGVRYIVNFDTRRKGEVRAAVKKGGGRRAAEVDLPGGGGRSMVAFEGASPREARAVVERLRKLGESRQGWRRQGGGRLFWPRAPDVGPAVPCFAGVPLRWSRPRQTDANLPPTCGWTAPLR